jgi:hypothetical protein
MTKTILAAMSAWIVIIAACVSRADEPKPDAEGFVPLFNGKDLSGWVIVNVAPGTFTVKDGIIVSTGKPTGVIRTEKQYENFIIELEWNHIKPAGNAGLFIWGDPVIAQGTPFTRGIEVQILDHELVAERERKTGKKQEGFTGHGDVFPIHGATMKPDRPHPQGSQRCLPSEFRAKPFGEWNHYRVVCNDGVIKLSVNGKEVSGGTMCSPRRIHLPGVGRLRVPLPEHQDQGTAEHQPIGRRNRARRREICLALHGRRSDRLEGRQGERRALAAERLDSQVRRQERSGRGQRQAPVDCQGLRRLRDDRRLAAGGQTGEEIVSGCAPQRR